jgi:hypothetical protein
MCTELRVKNCHVIVFCSESFAFRPSFATISGINHKKSRVVERPLADSKFISANMLQQALGVAETDGGHLIINFSDENESFWVSSCRNFFQFLGSSFSRFQVQITDFWMMKLSRRQQIRGNITQRDGIVVAEAPPEVEQSRFFI